MRLKPFIPRPAKEILATMLTRQQLRTKCNPFNYILSTQFITSGNLTNFTSLPYAFPVSHTF
uniref:Uncharacterized protein n=1 Tax=Romanomermis culicivorax TaxID=13658 RepID=A0A915HGH4_ROMCU